MAAQWNDESFVGGDRFGDSVSDDVVEYRGVNLGGGEKDDRGISIWRLVVTDVFEWKTTISKVVIGREIVASRSKSQWYEIGSEREVSLSGRVIVEMRCLKEEGAVHCEDIAEVDV